MDGDVAEVLYGLVLRILEEQAHPQLVPHRRDRREARRISRWPISMFLHRLILEEETLFGKTAPHPIIPANRQWEVAAVRMMMTVMREAEEDRKGVWKGNGFCDEVLRLRIGMWYRTSLLGQLVGEAGAVVPRLALVEVGGGSKEVKITKSG